MLTSFFRKSDCRASAIAFVVLWAGARLVQADAVVVTRAMQASTIVEIFIDEDRVRAEIEIGAEDLSSFANVLPDELHRDVTGIAEQFDERLKEFFASDWVIRGDGRPLQGRLERIGPAKRVVRDEVTGEALAEQPADARNVIRLLLTYELEDRPQTLSFHPPTDDGNVSASIGFICYHNGLPVNDFRYMAGELTLDLDWDDPWYSRFHHQNLRRQFDAPLSAYLYIEPYEVRKEIVVRPKDIQEWLDLEFRSDGVIPVDQQEELKSDVAEFLSTANPVSIDGRLAEGRLDRIHFIHRTLRATGIVEPAVDLDATSATLGVIFVYPIEKLPEHVSMTWELFSPKIQVVSTVASDEAGGLPTKITPDDPILEWKNYLTNPTIPQMLTVAPPPSRRYFVLPLISVLCGGVIVFIGNLSFRRRSTGNVVSRAGLVASFVAAAVGMFSLPYARVSIAVPYVTPAVQSEEVTEKIISSLLHNIYRAFDHHDDSIIYDRLAKSISGDLLSEVYLETRKSMEVKNQGGLRISVKEVEVTEMESVSRDSPDPTFQIRWRVAGWIGHWGHVHARTNEHVANISIAPRDDAWKITGMELLDEQPVEESKISDSRNQGERI